MQYHLTKRPDKRLAALVLAITVLVMGFGLAEAQTPSGSSGEKDITFSDIYAHPDDPDLNMAYARQRAEAGDYLAAASTLERMLFISPNWDSARLFYAAVLEKLDDRQGALRELDILKTRPLRPEQQKTAADMRARLSGEGGQLAANEKTQFHGRLAMGARYDDNAGNALSDNVLSPNALGDAALFAQGVLTFSTPLQDRLSFHARLDGYASAHQDVSRADIITVRGRLGLSAPLGDTLDFRIDADLGQTSIGGDRYLVEAGGKARLTRSLTEQTDVYAQAGWHDQNYDNLAFATSEEDRSGHKTRLDFGVEKRVLDKTRILVQAGYEKKTARNRAFAYDGLRVELGATHRLETGITLKANARFRKLGYDAPILVSGSLLERNDDRLSGRFAAAVSLDRLGRWMGAMENPRLRHISVETGVSGFTRSSSINSFDYENKGIDVRLSWTF